MGRLPKVRVSYYNDALYMLRLIHALELDKHRPLEWRKERIKELQALADAFQKPPQSDKVEEFKP